MQLSLRVTHRQWIQLILRGLIAVSVLSLLLSWRKTPRLLPQASPEVIHLNISSRNVSSTGAERGTNSVFDASGEGLCADNLFLLVYVHSSAQQFANRALLRSTWANSKNYDGLRMQVIFMLATPSNAIWTENIQREAQIYKDIVIFPHFETYKNISLKASAAIQLVAKRCKHVPFVIKTDDDVLINMFSIIDFLTNRVDDFIGRDPSVPTNSSMHLRRLLLCNVWLKPVPFRNPKHKWYISRQAYPDKYYPAFCSGLAWIMSSDVVVALSEAVRKTSQVFPFDDLWLTGILAEQEGIIQSQMGHHCQFLQKPETLSSDVLNKTVIFHGLDHNVFLYLWNSMITGVRPVLKPEKLTSTQRSNNS